MGVVFKLEKKLNDGIYIFIWIDIKFDKNGKVEMNGLLVGYYCLIEI